MSTDAVVTSKAGGVLTIGLNAPSRRNAIDNEMYVALAELIAQASVDPEVRVLLFHGEEGYFTSGNALSEFIGHDSNREFVPLRFFRAIASCGKPIVAAVEGGAIGVGATALLHCDVVYAGRGTRFQMPFIDFGLCPEGGSSLLLAQGGGYKRAARWLLLGESFNADQAVLGGLVTEVVDDRAALDHARAAAFKLAQHPPNAVVKTKELMRRGQHAALMLTLEEEGKHFSKLLASREAQDALSRFVDRLGRRKTSHAGEIEE
ncbi:enoyl-CoA hydratase-related protein [Paraburkholderia phymatum]|uniref:enoyl-CoA hydratase-related protein n=1 Tax=Paraburkholderia phymatum TaxID=148447 RepID=UPI00316D7339